MQLLFLALNNFELFLLTFGFWIINTIDYNLFEVALKSATVPVSFHQYSNSHPNHPTKIVISQSKRAFYVTSSSDPIHIPRHLPSSGTRSRSSTHKSALAPRGERDLAYHITNSEQEGSRDRFFRLKSGPLQLSCINFWEESFSPHRRRTQILKPENGHFLPGVTTPSDIQTESGYRRVGWSWTLWMRLFF